MARDVGDQEGDTGGSGGFLRCYAACPEDGDEAGWELRNGSSVEGVIEIGPECGGVPDVNRGAVTPGISRRHPDRDKRMCGRGGTLDKLEAISGLRTALSKAEFDRLLDDVGCALIGQTEDVAPADRHLYRLRDVTGTVDSIPLITASILSKKFATGAHAIVFDVKTGSGAFMADPADARTLGKSLVPTAATAGRKVSGWITAMDRPLGDAVGNANEVVEAIRMLGGEGPAGLREIVLLLGVDLVLSAGLEKSVKAARSRLNAALSDGRVLDVFARLVRGQGGHASVCDDPSRLPQPVARRDVVAAAPGVVSRLDTREIGLLAIEIGCGRRMVDDGIDPASGFRIRKKPGDTVAKGEPLVTVELGATAKPDEAFFARLASCFEIAPPGTPVSPLPLVVERL